MKRSRNNSSYKSKDNSTPKEEIEGSGKKEEELGGSGKKEEELARLERVLPKLILKKEQQPQPSNNRIRAKQHN